MSLNISRILYNAARWLESILQSKGLGSFESASQMPLRVDWHQVSAWKHDHYNVSSIHPLQGGKVLVGCYDNQSRRESRLHVVDTIGTVREIYKGGEETIGQGWADGGQWWIPVECGAQRVIGVPLDGAGASRLMDQRGKYSARIVDGHIGVGNKVCRLTDPAVTVATMPRLSGILCGLVADGDAWIASDDVNGIQSSRGWFVPCNCPDLAIVGGRVLAFLRPGEVRIVREGELGPSIGSTTRKCRRAWVDGGLCWWTTAPSNVDGHHQVWVTNGKSMLRVGQFKGRAEGTSAGALGSLFGSAVCVDADGAVWVVAGNETMDGWVLYKGAVAFK